MSVIDKANLIEKSRETVEQIMARRGTAKTYEEKAQYASDIVDMHLHEENPERIDECIKLYTEDAVWETPARNVTYKGRENIKKMYLRIFNSVENITFHPIERFSTPDRVFDDMLVRDNVAVAVDHEARALGRAAGALIGPEWGVAAARRRRNASLFPASCAPGS